MKHLFIQEYRHYLKPGFIDYDNPTPSIRLGYAARGWYPITDSIKRGDFIKVSAARDGVLVEAQFNIKTNVPRGDNGSYDIRHGLFAGKGVFRNVAQKENPDFPFFFLCHSTTANGLFLRWQIGVDGFADANAVLDEDCSYQVTPLPRRAEF